MQEKFSDGGNPVKFSASLIQHKKGLEKGARYIPVTFTRNDRVVIAGPAILVNDFTDVPDTFFLKFVGEVPADMRKVGARYALEQVEGYEHIRFPNGDRVLVTSGACCRNAV